MRVFLLLMFIAACALASNLDNRRNKLPFVADAVGNTIPPPSNGPATVGSPVNLLTPDRYEFYTFDESGELVKRLMTLEEIQAIVAAGEETEGLVTFANDNPPTVAFNVPQAPITKVHSVVTNVQNVLKAQMEAHKNRPQIQPTLDTPDVSDSWSLILPSIFGNTGVDIVLDKTSGSVTTPETETIEESNEEDEESLSKEGDHQVFGSSSTTVEEKSVVTEMIPLQEDASQTISTVTTTSTSTTTTTTTHKPTTSAPKPTTSAPKSTTTTRKPITTTRKPTTTTTKPTTTTTKPTTTTTKPTTTTSKSTTTTLQSTTAKLTTTTSKPITTTKVTTRATRRPISNTKRPLSTTKVTSTSAFQNITTTKPRGTSTTIQPTTPNPVIRTTSQTTIVKPESTTKKHIVSVPVDTEAVIVHTQSNSNAASSTERNEIEFEKLSTFIPVSTVKYVSERTTNKPPVNTKLPIVHTSTTINKHVTTTTKAPTTQSTKVQPLITTFKPMLSTFASSTVRNPSNGKVNTTTITTQSVSPSTTVSSTEYLSADEVNLPNNVENESLPLFDVAQSISQIASDLGNDYQHVPTTNNLLDNNNESQIDLESKENIDIDIPSGTGNETGLKTSDIANNTDDNFIKISTIDPHNKNEVEKLDRLSTENIIDIKKASEKENTDNEKKYGNKKNNIIIESVQKVEFTSTPVTTESTTIDPILSESMDDLLSQVVNQAPPIIDSKDKQEEKSTTIKENDITSTTTESSKDMETTFKTSLKVKKDTSTTTDKSVESVTEKQAAVSNGGSVTKNVVNLQTEKPENESTVIIPTPSKPANTKIDLDVKAEKSEMESISSTSIPSSHHSASITDNDSDRNKLQNVNNVSGSSINKIEDTIEKVEIPLSRNDSKTAKPEYKNENKTENSTIISDTEVSEKNITLNKISQSKINEIDLKDKTNGINKNGKLPELWPKVDDFRKKNQKVDIDKEELGSLRNNSWKLVPTLSPPKANEIPKDKVKADDQYNHVTNDNKDVVLEFSNENQGLEVTTKDLDEDIAKFSELSNELAFRYWSIIVDDIDKRRSFVFSPYSTFSMLAMIFMGAKGATSGEMNEILKLDDMFTFNPHFTLKNISDSIETTPQSGVAVSAFTRELYSDRNKGKILTFYKERAQHFYNGHVEEINFKLISDIIRRRTNLLVKRYTWGKMPEFMKTNNIVMQPPLAAFTANIFQTDCTGTSVDGRDGEMYFVVSPNVRQRRLVPVPAVVYKNGFLAGYDPVLDVTVAALGNTNTIVSTMFLMPKQQGSVVHADDLEKLEQRLLESIPTTPTWNRVLRSLLPRTGLELQIPRFSHKSTFNASSTLKKMGLKDLFDGEHADLGGLNGPSKDLYLSDMLQLNTFVTCGEGVVGEQHHIEEYPETLTVSQRRRARWLNDWDEPRDYQRAFHDPHDISDAMHLPLHLRPRQARLPARSNQPMRLKFDRPFLYFVRHNPSGMILYFGRYNPRLLP